MTYCRGEGVWDGERTRGVEKKREMKGENNFGGILKHCLLAGPIKGHIDIFCAVMDVCICHINISPNHPFSPFFSLIKMFPCQTLLKDLFLLLATDFSHFPLSLSHHSVCVYLTLSPVSHHSFCCHSTLCHQAVRANHGAADHCASDHYTDLPLWWNLRGNTAWSRQTCRWFCWRHLLEL